MYTMPELTPAKLEALWGNYTQCGNPCGCEQ